MGQYSSSIRMGRFTQICILLAIVSLAAGDLIRGHGRRGRHGLQQRGRQGRQEEAEAPAVGVDFSSCVQDPETNLCCVEKLETVTTIEKEPLLECTHKTVEKCHYTYVTEFSPVQEEVCEENFEKTCQITFKQQAVNETIEKCYRPLSKVCNGQGEEVCQTVYESSCSTKYIEKQPGKFVGDTKCEKLPIEICGAGCVTEPGEEECHQKVLTSLIDVPEEVCDLNPQKTCKFQTKLVPRLGPAHECTEIPREVCHLKFGNPEPVEKPLKTKWCLDETEPTPDETYDESEALGEPLAQASEPIESILPSYGQPQYGAPAQQNYGVPTARRY